MRTNILIACSLVVGLCTWTIADAAILNLGGVYQECIDYYALLLDILYDNIYGRRCLTM